MPGMGLDTAFGAQGSADAIQQVFERRMQQAASDRAQKALEQNDALTRLKVAEQAAAIRDRVEAQKQAEKDRSDAAKAAEQDRQDRQAASTFTMNPVGSDLPAPIAGRAQALGFPVQKIAGPQVQQTAGFMPLPSAGPTGPGMQTVQGLTPIDGPQMGAGQASTSADPQSPMNAPDTFKRGATQADVVKKREDDQKAADQEWQRTIQQELATLKEGQGGQKDHFTPVPQYENGQPVGTLAFNTSSGTGTPLMVGGKAVVNKAAPGAAADAKTKAETDKAINVLGQLDSSLDSVKDLVGPAAGRGQTVEQWLGTADPKIQAFGTKLLMAKLIVDKAVTGSARAGASPALIARWDNLLSNKVSYEGMKAALQAAKEIIAAGAPQAGGGGFRVVGERPKD